MAASLPLVSARRRVPALLTGTALAAASGASAETALLNVSVIVEPRCAVAAPARIPQEDATRIMADPAGRLDIACTAGTSWSVEAGEATQPAIEARPVVAHADRALQTRSVALSAEPPNASEARWTPTDLVRITVRY